VTLDDSVKSCSADGILDSGETGRLTIKVVNPGPIALEHARLLVSSKTAGATFPAGAVVDVPAVPPLGSQEVSVQVALAAGVADPFAFSADVSLDADAACDVGGKVTVVQRVNYDDIPASSATDDAESAGSHWLGMGTGADNVWSRALTDSPPDHAYRGLDWGSMSDTALRSPVLKVSAAGSFVMEFDHRHQFEAGVEQGTAYNFDGGVVEISTDARVWKDVTQYQADPGYGGDLTSVSGNPLGGRKALVGESPSWPKRDHVKLDFGSAFAGQSVYVRFRIGSDQAAGAFGWEIDNIAFQGIDNLPFGSIHPKAVACPVPQPPAPAAKSGCGCQGAFADAALLPALLVALRLRRRRA
jgi:hypothetical protein